MWLITLQRKKTGRMCATIRNIPHGTANNRPSDRPVRVGAREWHQIARLIYALEIRGNNTRVECVEARVVGHGGCLARGESVRILLTPHPMKPLPEVNIFELI